MKKIVIVFTILATFGSLQTFGQTASILLKPDRAVVAPSSVFLAPPTFIKSFQETQGHENGTLSTDWVQYVDTVTQQFAYTYFPSILNVTQQDGSIIPDTVVGYSERFTSPYNASTYLDSVQVGIGIPDGSLTSGANGFRLIISAWTQTVDPTNHLPFPKTLIDSTSISYDDLTTLTTGTLQFVTVKMNHKKVGRTFFVTVETPYDLSSDLSSQQIIGIFGDSLDSPTTIDTSVQRGLASGFPYILYWTGITRGGGSPFYQNFFISALVNSVAAGVADSKLSGNALAQNFPNPVNAQSEIKYSLANGGRASLKVYNALGVEVATLADEFETSGEHQASFNADKLPSGTYYYTLRNGDFSQTKQMIVTK